MINHSHQKMQISHRLKPIPINTSFSLYSFRQQNDNNIERMIKKQNKLNHQSSYNISICKKYHQQYEHSNTHRIITKKIFNGYSVPRNLLINKTLSRCDKNQINSNKLKHNTTVRGKNNNLNVVRKIRHKNQINAHIFQRKLRKKQNQSQNRQLPHKQQQITTQTIQSTYLITQNTQPIETRMMEQTVGLNNFYNKGTSEMIHKNNQQNRQISKFFQQQQSLSSVVHENCFYLSEYENIEQNKVRKQINVRNQHLKKNQKQKQMERLRRIQVQKEIQKRERERQIQIQRQRQKQKQKQKQRQKQRQRQRQKQRERQKQKQKQKQRQRQRQRQAQLQRQIKIQRQRQKQQQRQRQRERQIQIEREREQQRQRLQQQNRQQIQVTNTSTQSSQATIDTLISNTEQIISFVSYLSINDESLNAIITQLLELNSITYQIRWLRELGLNLGLRLTGAFGERINQLQNALIGQISNVLIRNFRDRLVTEFQNLLVLRPSSTFKDNRITKQEIQNLFPMKQSAISDQCSICLIQLQCKHIFHPQCIDNWLNESIKCPLCRYYQKKNC